MYILTVISQNLQFLNKQDGTARKIIHVGYESSGMLRSLLKLNNTIGKWELPKVNYIFQILVHSIKHCMGVICRHQFL